MTPTHELSEETRFVLRKMLAEIECDLGLNETEIKISRGPHTTIALAREISWQRTRAAALREVLGE